MTTGVVVLLAGLIVLAGWHYGLRELASFRADWATMKPATALGFVLSGAALIASNARKTVSANAAVVSICVCLLAVLVSVVIQTALGFDVFISDSSLIESVEHGVPSLATLACFTMVAVSGMTFHQWPRVTRFSSVAICLLASGALLGYALGVPWLRFWIPGYSTAMAMPTALLFGLIAFELWQVSRE